MSMVSEKVTSSEITPPKIVSTSPVEEATQPPSSKHAQSNV